MTFKKIITSLFITVLLAAPLTGQVVHWIDELDLTVDDLKVVLISDLNLLNVRDVPIYLTARGEIQLRVGDDNNTNFVLEMGLSFQGAPVVVQRTKPFTLNELGLNDGNTVYFTNLIFNDGRFSPSQINPVTWGTSDVNFPPGFEDELGTGVLPAGQYVLYATFYQDGQPDTDTPDATVDMNLIGLPTFLEPIYPGIDFGSDNVPTVYQENPVFQWRSGGPNDYSEYEFKIWLKEPFHQSLNDIVQSDPYYVSLKEEIPGSQFVYPYPPGGKPLLTGGTFVWQVAGIIPSSSGPDILRVDSQYFIFTVVQPGTGGGSTFGSVEFLLKKLFGGDIPEDVVKKLEEVNFRGVIRLNGRQISPTDLNRLVKKLSSTAADNGVDVSDYINDYSVQEK